MSAGGVDFAIFRVLEAPRERVWAALTDPEQMKEWWTPATFTMIAMNMEKPPSADRADTVKWGRRLYLGAGIQAFQGWTFPSSIRCDANQPSRGAQLAGFPA